MNNLRQLTQEIHAQAERQEFVKVLLSGKINPELYAHYLWNQYLKYYTLETTVAFTEFSQLNIQRYKRILSDFYELWDDEYLPVILPSVSNYINYVKKHADDTHRLLAHVYVMHMGDMSGGQMIAAKVPGSGTMYEFDCDIPSTKEKIRSLVTDDHAAEAHVCFGYAIDVFQEIMNINCEHYVRNTE